MDSYDKSFCLIVARLPCRWENVTQAFSILLCDNEAYRGQWSEHFPRRLVGD